MAAIFTPITLPEIAQTLTRSFRVLRPRLGPVIRGEVTYDVPLSDAVVVRVFTSVHQGGDAGADVGTDAIRIGLISAKSGRPLKSGKMSIVKRTQGWASNLRERIEDEMGDYDEKEAYWESRA